MDYISYIIVKAISALLGTLGTKSKGVIQTALQFVLSKIFGYRKEVVQSNLALSFPNLSTKELNKIQNQYYSNLSNQIIQTLDMPNLSLEYLKSKFTYINPEVFKNSYQEGQDIFLLTGHFFNWEWGQLVANTFCDHQVVGVVKPLKNKHINQLIYEFRSESPSILISPKQLPKALLTKSEKPRIFMIVADQNPSTANGLIWLDFMNRQTAFSLSIESIAERYSIPVFYADISNTDSGFQMNAKPIKLHYDKGNSIKITERYAQMLEENIKSDPANWVWSHRRWKRNQV